MIFKPRVNGHMENLSAALSARRFRREKPPPAGAAKRSGAAAAEFALMGTVVMFLMLGTFEIARGIIIKQVLNDAARKACRTGVLPTKGNSDIVNEVNTVMTNNGIATAYATTTTLVSGKSGVDALNAIPGVDSVSVKVQIQMSNVNWAGTFFLSGSAQESETVVMVKQ
jgi:Flp pilus assembly protein TadG